MGYLVGPNPPNLCPTQKTGDTVKEVHVVYCFTGDMYLDTLVLSEHILYVVIQYNDSNKVNGLDCGLPGVLIFDTFLISCLESKTRDDSVPDGDKPPTELSLGVTSSKSVVYVTVNGQTVGTLQIIRFLHSLYNSVHKTKNI